MLRSPVVKKLSGSTSLSYHAEIQAGEQHVTEFSWALRDWNLLYDSVYSQGVLSDSFPLNGINQCTCQLSLYPGNSKNPLTIEFSDPTRILAVKIILSNHVTQKFENCYSHPVAKIIHPSGIHIQRKNLKLSVLMSDDTTTRLLNTLQINAQFTIKTFPKNSDSLLLKPICSKTNVLRNMETMLNKKTLCDVTFVFGWKKLPAHKAVLAAQSKVFEMMFQSEMKEKETSTVEITDIKAEVFEKFLAYLYIGEVKNLENMAVEMILVADKYEVYDLKQLCEKHMLVNLCDKNAVEYLIIADKLCCKTLKTRAINLLKCSGTAWVQAILNEDLETFVILRQIFSNDCT
ncbi:speckle-type POZ protein-like [Venturia canescens]|uniref:speckle-type POZ protein-like n=1 Tax=Venturia canescens TaxID=32260 RepID=UPI001C9CA235|nr:speckle-type POZ protein-like [Venturia canescens]